VRDHRHSRLPHGDDTESAAKAHPSQKFAIVDYTYSPSIKNIDALVFDTVQDGFLGGYLAAGMSKTHKVATFGGLKLPTVTIYMDGFWDGVQYYNRKHGTDVKVLGWSEATQNGSFTVTSRTRPRASSSLRPSSPRVQTSSSRWQATSALVPPQP